MKLSKIPVSLSICSWQIVINSIRNSLVLAGNALYNEDQFPIIQLLIGGGANNANITPSSFLDRVNDIEDNIGISDLSVDEQTPLFLATTLGQNSYSYWASELAKGSSSWASYFTVPTGQTGQNYMNTSVWAVEAMNGALAGYGASPRGLISPTTEIVSTQMISALIGALTATAGKVIFNWIPRITTFDKATLASLSTGTTTTKSAAEFTATISVAVSVILHPFTLKTQSSKSKCDTPMNRCQC